ncbi:MAG: L-aspartate oxidase [Dehalococcoidia bacterium]|nr:L-aspartate oxidase [Dehalococcoidia bacterium]
MVYDYIIIGSGIAGLYTALQACEHGSVLVLTKGSIDECNTKYAQGGIAAPIGPGDSPDLHFRDTMAAGAGLSSELAVRILTEEAADRIGDLIRFGVPFDTVNGEIALAKEGAHSLSRILHSGGDATGANIETTMTALASASGAHILEHYLVTGIEVRDGRVAGVVALDCQTGARKQFECRFLIVATGGAGQLFKFNTNPAVATGDGVALAYRAGAVVTDMEFFQFHPTVLQVAGAPHFLISEAVRGEGGVLRNIHGERFMPSRHPQGELAPRDAVANAILREMQETGADHVLLDVTHLDPTRIKARFPSIYRSCLGLGLDITVLPVPVAPAAHYLMGGIMTDQWGETNVSGLFACGESACTGVHGANRLGSNSLLEVLVFSKRIFLKTLSRDKNMDYRTAGSDGMLPPIQAYVDPQVTQSKLVTANVSQEAVQTIMWENAGMTRSAISLDEASRQLDAISAATGEPIDRPSYELDNLLLLGRILVHAAGLREESRGAHYRSDFPIESASWRRHIRFINNH